MNFLSSIEYYYQAFNFSLCTIYLESDGQFPESFCGYSSIICYTFRSTFSILAPSSRINTCLEGRFVNPAVKKVTTVDGSKVFFKENLILDGPSAAIFCKVTLSFITGTFHSGFRTLIGKVTLIPTVIAFWGSPIRWFPLFR